MKRIFLVLTTLVFTAGFIGGCLLPFYSHDTAEHLVNLIGGAIRERLGVELRPSVQLSLAIFLNNLKVVLLTLAFGFTIIGPLLVAAGNGAILGLVASYSVLKGYSPLVVAASILPHGVLELGAVLYVIGFSIELGWNFWRSALKGSLGEYKGLLRAAPRRLAPAVLAIFVAALIEGLVTPVVVAWVRGF
ncbi:MAG: stage II sporulation protein M [Infirmifilum sp.]